MSSDKTPLSDLSTLSSYPQRVLVLCPHPDDFDVAGVTLKHFAAQGSEIFAAVAPTFSGILDSFFEQPATNQQRIETREKEQQQSLQFFGLDDARISFFPHSSDLDENGELCVSEQNLQRVQNALSAVKPDCLFIPHPNDTNPAHSAMYQMVVTALKNLGLQASLYLQMDPKTQDIQINAYTPINSQQADWKAQLLKHHQTQDHRNLQTRGTGIDHRILSKNGEAAKELQLDHAWIEAFEVVDSSSLL